jgi:hypothetical protein
MDKACDVKPMILPLVRVSYREPQLKPKLLILRQTVKEGFVFSLSIWLGHIISRHRTAIGTVGCF